MKKILALLLLSISFLSCRTSSEDEVTSTSSGCQATTCHAASPLGEFFPTSGQHSSHTTDTNPACGDCHYNYESNALHKNEETNGYDTKTDTEKFGEIVSFDRSKHPNVIWDNSTGFCNNIDCHQDHPESAPSIISVDWYKGCSSCH